MCLLLLDDELVEVSAGAELHDDVELLPFDDGLAVGDDVGVLEGLQQLHLVEDVLRLLGVLVGQLHLLYHVLLPLRHLHCQVRVSEGPELLIPYPCPMIFKILYCYIINRIPQPATTISHPLAPTCTLLSSFLPSVVPAISQIKKHELFLSSTVASHS